MDKRIIEELGEEEILIKWFLWDFNSRILILRRGPYPLTQDDLSDVKMKRILDPFGGDFNPSLTSPNSLILLHS